LGCTTDTCAWSTRSHIRTVGHRRACHRLRMRLPPDDPAGATALRRTRLGRYTLAPRARAAVLTTRLLASLKGAMANADTVAPRMCPRTVFISCCFPAPFPRTCHNTNVTLNDEQASWRRCHWQAHSGDAGRDAPRRVLFRSGCLDSCSRRRGQRPWCSLLPWRRYICSMCRCARAEGRSGLR
jgi:hypothetical protein